MRDPRIQQLAKNLINYSVRLQPGEKILIEVAGSAGSLPIDLIEQSYRAGGIPFITIKNAEVQRSLLMDAGVEQVKMMARYELERMKDMDAYIGIGARENASELSDVSSAKVKIYMEHFSKPVHTEQRVNHTKWCILRYPNPSMAQAAGQSTASFEDFYFRVCNLDYRKMSKAMDRLVDLMEKTDRVRITGPGTDLYFSIKNMPAIKCAGELNIPDGEVFTAPLRESVNGLLTYNTPAVYQGFTYNNIALEFKDGKIIKATANNTERINEVFDTDEGARYIGEFALGVNPFILEPMKDTLFDEKICGSFHFTPGSCYDECNNGNKSAIHWDLVSIQRPEYGGGEIWFDDSLVRKDGLFIPAELQSLNPDALK